MKSFSGTAIFGGSLSSYKQTPPTEPPALLRSLALLLPQGRPAGTPGGGEQRKSQPGPLWGTASRKRGRSGFYFSQQLRSSLTQHRLPSVADPALPRSRRTCAALPLAPGVPAERGVRPHLERPVLAATRGRSGRAPVRVPAAVRGGRRPRDLSLQPPLTDMAPPACPHRTWWRLSLAPRGLRPAAVIPAWFLLSRQCCCHRPLHGHSRAVTPT